MSILGIVITAITVVSFIAITVVINKPSIIGA
jgi:hypothetical protein